VLPRPSAPLLQHTASSVMPSSRRDMTCSASRKYKYWFRVSICTVVLPASQLCHRMNSSSSSFGSGASSCNGNRCVRTWVARVADGLEPGYQGLIMGIQHATHCPAMNTWHQWGSVHLAFHTPIDCLYAAAQLNLIPTPSWLIAVGRPTQEHHQRAGGALMHTSSRCKHSTARAEQAGLRKQHLYEKPADCRKGTFDDVVRRA
jgi:hypothetical protein